MIEQLSFLLLYVFEAFISYIYYSENFDKKHHYIITVISSLCLYLLGFTINLFDNNNFIVNVLSFFAINLILSILLFEIKITSAILHSSILLGIMISTEFITSTIATALFKIPIDAYKNNVYLLFALGIICKILYLIVCKVISSLFSYKNKTGANNFKKDFLLFLYPIMCVIMLTAFLYASFNYELSKNLNLAFLTISIISLALSCFIFIYNQNIQKQENELRVLQDAKQKEDINRTFYEMLERKNHEQRILIHDVKHHFNAMSSMEDIKQIKKYLSKIQTQIDEYQFIGKTNNKMFDLVLSKYAHICSNCHIGLNVDVRASNLNFIADDDLVSLISNILDNAVEASSKCENSHIELKTKSEKSFIVLTVINSSNLKPKENSGKLITTKSNSNIHGYGMKSIQRTSKKYDGECQWHYDESKKEFHLNILFNKK